MALVGSIAGRLQSSTIFCHPQILSASPAPTRSSRSLHTQDGLQWRALHPLRRQSTPVLTHKKGSTFQSRNTQSVRCLGAADSSEGLPQDLLEDAKFVKVNDDDPRFGPPVMLLLGFPSDEVPKVREMLDNMSGEFLQISVCTQDMVKGSLSAAIHTEQRDPFKVKPASNLPRICFLSGLTGEEIMMVVGTWPEAGLEPTVFAAMVPNNANKSLSELIEEIMGDHERLTGSASANARGA